MSDNFNVIMRVYFVRAKWGNLFCSPHFISQSVSVSVCLQNSHQSFAKLNHCTAIFVNIRDPLTYTHKAQIGVWCRQRRTNWNRIKTRNMKLSIFDQSVYIRSLKLNGSTFNAYFKRFDRCETTFMWTTNLELSVTESRWYNTYRKYEAFFFRK